MSNSNIELISNSVSIGNLVLNIFYTFIFVVIIAGIISGSKK